MNLFKNANGDLKCKNNCLCEFRRLKFINEEAFMIFVYYGLILSKLIQICIQIIY